MASLIHRALIAALSAVAWTSATASCLAYEPAEVTLVGKVSFRTFAGPPNYQSVANGDTAERVALLELTAPICVRSNTSDLINVSRDDIKIVQLVLMRKINIEDGQA